MKVRLMTELILMPISWEVSKSFEAARMAIPTFVLWIRKTSTITSRITRGGVITVTRFVVTPKTVMTSEIHGIVGYCCARPPVI